MQHANEVAAAAVRRPLNGHQFSQLAQAIAGLDAEQLRWASRYLAGLVAKGEEPVRLRGCGGPV